MKIEIRDETDAKKFEGAVSDFPTYDSNLPQHGPKTTSDLQVYLKKF